MSNCVMCGAPIPDRQRTCSMCYGDPDHGSDGYYRQWLEDQSRRSEDDRADREREPEPQGE